MTQEATNLKNLKRELTLPMVFSVALKQVIGGGVIALTGIAIGITGAGAPLAYALAAMTSIMAGIPFAILSSAMPVTGGIYTWPARLISPMVGFLTLWSFFLTNVALSLYAMTATDFIRVFYPELPATLLAFSILTIFYILNLSGAKATARVGVILTMIMLSSIVLFILSGMQQINPDNFATLLPNGVFSLFSAAGLLLFATAGAAAVGELGGEMKRPGRDIPIAIIGATSVAAILYILTSIVAVGILPLEEVANKSLNVIADKIMSRSAFLYFTIGAGIISLLGIINAQMLWGSKSLLVACDDNWLPRRLGSVNKRFGTPHYLLTALYFVGIFPILTGLTLKDTAIASNIAGSVAQIVVILTCLVLYRRRRGLYDAALFKIQNKWLLNLFIGVALCLQGFLAWTLMMMEGNVATVAIMAGWFTIGVVIALSRKTQVSLAAKTPGT